MKEGPPSIIQSLRHTIEFGSETEALAAQIKLTEMLSKGGKKAAAKRRENKANLEALRKSQQEAELSEFIANLLAANAHLAAPGTYPPDIEELLKQYRPE